MIRLVLSDMDNTLIPFGEEHATERTLRAIHACLDAGVRFGPATGRNRLEVGTFLRGDAACYATGIFTNGQQAYLDNRLVFEVTLDRSALRRAEEVLRGRRRCALITYRPDGWADWVGDERAALGEFVERAMILGDTRHATLPEYPVAKAGIIALLERSEELALQSELAEACPELDFMNTVVRWFDVVPHGWSKAKAIGPLCDELGIGRDEVCVFGDAENDMAMFGCVTHSCAVANAVPEVSELARWHIGASADGGVARALEQIAAAARDHTTPAFMEPAGA